MRICHVITRLIVGGAQENTLLTCRGLAERGHQVVLIAGPQTGAEGSLWNAARECGCEVVEVKALRRRVRPLKDLVAIGSLGRLFERLRPDVVHTHSSKAGILGRWAAVRARVPVIVHTIHGMSFNRTQSAPVRALYRFLERRAARSTHAIVTVADAMIVQALESRIAPANRFVTIRSGMETSRFVPDRQARERVRAKWGVSDDEVVVGTIARLFENKGYEEILAAMPHAVSREGRLKFVWIGDGIRRSDYERKLQALGLQDRVKMVGLISPEAIPEHVNGFDIILHASRWEGLPRAIVQGLLMGLPAISFDNDGAPEVVLPGETGMLVPFGQSAGLAEAIVELARAPELRHRLGARGRELCLKLFDWRRMVDDLEALYVRLAKAST